MDAYEDSPLFSEREKAALRYADAINLDPTLSDEALWEALHRHFSEPELVELGQFIALQAGNHRWIRILDLQHGQVLPGTTGGLSQEAVQRVGPEGGGIASEEPKQGT